MVDDGVTPIVSPTGHRTRAALVTFAAASGYALLAFGGLRLAENFFAGMFFLSLAFMVAVPFTYATMRAAAIGTRWPLVLTALGATALAFVLAPEGSSAAALFEMTRIFTSGYLVGYLVSRRKGLSRAYIIGLVWLLATCVVQYWTVWPEIIERMKLVGNELVHWLEKNPAFTTASSDMQDEMMNSFKAWSAMSARLSPVSLMFLPIIQLSLGYLWFLFQGVKDGRLSMWDIRFARWRMPWQLSPVLILAIAMRLSGGETMQLIADNLITILAIYYCVTGLALVDWFMKLLKLALWFRILFYIFLIITGVLGLVIVSVLGFIDSFRDFRRNSTVDLDLKKE